MNSRSLPCYLALVSSLGGCADDSASEGDEGAATDSTTTDDASTGSDQEMVVELRPDLCDDPANAALIDRIMPQGADASFGETNEETLAQMLANPLDGPFYMVNLIRYREFAQYPDGRQTDLTGREADALYAPVEFLEAIGASVVFTAEVEDVVIGEAGAWETIAIVEYPCPLALFAMSADPEFSERAIHKDAGVEASIVMVTDLQPSPLPEGSSPPSSPFPATPEDPSLEMVHVTRYHDIAQYPPELDEPMRTGREAMDLYSNGAAEAAARVGTYPTAWFTVRGVYIGDGRPFDEVRINHMPSRAAWEALVSDPTRLDGQYHREAALDYSYSMLSRPQISSVPGAPSSNEGLPVAPDGTGTPCQSDADCPTTGATHCLSDGGTGFCTVQGCGAGECEAPYACCRDCSEAIAPMLPFAESACLPAEAAAQLATEPAGCTCD